MHPMLEDRAMPGDPSGRRRVTMNVAESVTGWLHARGLLNQRQALAADMLRQDYERAGLSARVTMDWDAPVHSGGRRGGAGGDGVALLRIDAHQRFHAAMAAAGPGLSDILWRTVCGGEAMAGAERALGWPVRSGRVVLALALDRVAAYHRLP